MKLTVVMLVALLLFCYGVGSVRCSTNSTDMLALLDFKAAITDDSKGVLSRYWNSSTPYCQWKGVKCSSSHPGRVTMLDLAAQGLSGPIATSVGNLTFLHTLDLSHNQFSGQIPHLNKLHKMQTLNLSFNSLEGTIPDTLTNCSNLKKLDLDTNFLKGSIPPHIGLLTNLVYMDISGNNLTGIIPSSLGNITYLQTIFLEANELEGSIPDELGRLSNISVLGLGQNKLSGSIPQSLYNSSSLQQLELRENQLRDTLPTDMGDHLPNLHTLLMSANMLEGHIPASLGNASNLDTLVLQINSLTGKIPISFGKLSRLSKLDIQANMLEAKDEDGWEFLQALGNCRLLKALALANNPLQGVIPNSIGNLSTSLEVLVMGNTALSGMVPPSIGNLSRLNLLTLDVNSLTGNIDEWVGNLKSLQGLHLEMNNFTGLIPPSIGHITRLTQLYLQNNSFQGPLPSSLGNLQELLTLNLSSNNFEGSIPPEFSNLKQLIQLSISWNMITGEIPTALVQCQELINLQMEHNFLTGRIPLSFGNLTTLGVLNLSHNNLSGTIPAALGDLQLLTLLDLSYNHLQGKIPTNGVFRNAKAVSLEGNWGLCGGTIDIYMPLCPDVSKRSKAEYYLIRTLIPIFGFTSLIMLIYTLLLGKKKSQKTHLLLLSFGKKFPVISYNDLRRATRNFSESVVIGRGSYGSVYLGKLTQAKIQVAIKVFDLDIKCADKSFVTECDVLRSIRHRNLLPILTACSTIDNNGDGFKALVYEYMSNGNLDKWLHNKSSGDCSKCLSLVQRVSILVGVADALAYLYHDCERLIVHCDLKPNNILLDDDMNAYLGDFGIASLLGYSGPNISFGLKGTIGYIAPEYAQSVHSSTRGDVYSFGIVLLEVLIGKRPTDPMFENDLNMVTFVEKSYPDQILSAIDVHLHEELKNYIQAGVKTEDKIYVCLLSLIQVALSCTRVTPKERMNMREVATKLHAVRTCTLELASKGASHSLVE